jgi:protein NUD1
MNPCTLSWYLPLLVRDVPGALQPSGEGGPGRGDVGYGGGGDNGWAELDTKFRRNLPNDAYLGRLAYRGLMMRACPKLKRLDGVEVTEKERIKAAQILTSIWEKNGGKGTAARVR